MTEIIHKELSYQLVGCIFDVHNEVGPVAVHSPLG